jgi:hypothetical protein
MLSSVTGEQVIAVIPDETGQQRVVFVARAGERELPIVLRQQSFSAAVGWFTQSQIEMTRAQMVMLRSSLGAAGCGQACTQPPVTAKRAMEEDSSHEPATILSLADVRDARRVKAS